MAYKHKAAAKKTIKAGSIAAVAAVTCLKTPYLKDYPEISIPLIVAVLKYIENFVRHKFHISIFQDEL